LIVLKAVFVDEPALQAAGHTNVASADLLPRTIVAVLAAAVLLIGVVPQTLVAQILAAVP
jgi:NADH:ubiquinone oxidoreductase subunit 4 (subunit M)